MYSSDDRFDQDQQMLNRWFRKHKIMDVNFINGRSSEIPVRQTTVRPPPTTVTGSAPDSFTTSLSGSQNQPAASRPEKIARASELLADGNYPSDKVLNQLAGFLAGKL